MSKSPKKPQKGRPPTLAEIADALEISTRRVSQLKESGMPVYSVEAARSWRRDKSQLGDSAEALRRERIKLVRAQRERAELENAQARGELISKAEVADQHQRIAFAIQAHLRKLENEIPPLCLGLPLEKSRPAVKKFVRETQLKLAQRHPDFWPNEIPQP